MIVFIMKKLLLGLSFALSFSFASGASFVLADASPAHAATTGYVSDLPSNIDLNDTSEANIRAYYNSLNSLPDSERQGTNLLKNLKPILKNMAYYSYDNVWKIYEITDREWALSPVEEITYGTYNPTTNKYSSYQYGSNSSPKNNPWIHTLYRNRDSNGVTVESGRIREWPYGSYTSQTIHNQTGGTNREHVWCQSRGFKAGKDQSPTGPAGTDVHHLISGDGYVNGKPHNNNPYGYVKPGSVTIDSKTSYAYCEGNVCGAPLHPHAGEDQSSVVFEPQDCDKGDIARACFYMVARYNNLSGTDTITQFEPNLTMANYATSSGDHEDSSATHPVAMGILSDLLEWHKLDPVDEYGIHRNNLIYNNYQFNRNPFIDFPEWVDYIWGTAEDGVYDSTSKGVAKPSTDTINGYNDPTVPTGSVTISQTSASVTVGETVTLTATASDSSTVSWASSADSIATVEDGVVTGVSKGNATITASATIGGQKYSASCEVTVNAAPSISISVPSATLQVGDSVTLTAAASDDSAITWVSSAPGVASVADGVVTGVSEGNATITATATIGGKNYSATCEITVIAAPADPSSVKLTEIALDTSKVKKNFFVGDTFTSEGLIVTARYDNGTSKTVTPSEITKPDMSTPGAKTVTVSFTDNSVTKSSVYNITVSPVQHTITASCEKSFFVGESIKKSDITVKDENGAAVTDFTMSDETDGQYTFLYSDAASGGAETDKKFTISHNDASTVLTVKVSRRAPNQEATAANLADFLLYKDANQMSDADWEEAIRIFNAMSKEERVTFMTSTDYILKSAMTRFVSKLKVYESGGDYEVKGHERSVTPSTDPKQGGIPNLYLYIAIGAGALLVLIVVIIILVHSKKARKVAKKAVKKAIKSSTKKKK